MKQIVQMSQHSKYSLSSVSLQQICQGALLTLICVLVLYPATTYAQSAYANKLPATTTPQESVESNDQLCMLSNGNKIPCIYKIDAESDIADGPAITEKTTGKKLCVSEVGTYLECTMLNKDGTIKAEFWQMKMQIKIQKLWQQTKSGQMQNVLLAAALGIVAIVGTVIFIKRKKKNNSIQN